MKKTPIPSHLSPDSAAWYRALMRDYQFEPHALRVIQVTAEAWDRKEVARGILAEQGLTVTDTNGAIKAHPCVAIERDARIAFLRGVRELNLPADEAPTECRPPMLQNRYKGR